MKPVTLLLAALLLCPTLRGDDDAPTPKAAHAVFDRLKALAGSWEGTLLEEGKTLPATVRFKLVSDGSALALWLGEDSPYEMVTMFYLDGGGVAATHYSLAHNQPRMVLVPGDDPHRFEFHFKGGTNIKPGDYHLQRLVLIFDRPDHHTEEWAFVDKDKETEPSRFDFHRKP